jgi:D-mannonate dehydratase
LDVYRKQNKQQSIEISNLRKGSANLKAQLLTLSTSRVWHASEFKNARNQLVESTLSRKIIEERLAMDIIKLKSENAKLRARGDRAIKILKRAAKTGQNMAESET